MIILTRLLHVKNTADNSKWCDSGNGCHPWFNGTPGFRLGKLDRSPVGEVILRLYSYWILRPRSHPWMRSSFRKRILGSKTSSQRYGYSLPSTLERTADEDLPGALTKTDQSPVTSCARDWLTASAARRSSPNVFCHWNSQILDPVQVHSL